MMDAKLRRHARNLARHVQSIGDSHPLPETVLSAGNSNRP